MPAGETIAMALRQGAAALQGVGVNPRFDAEMLMAHALGCSRSDMLLRHMDAAVPASFAALLARRMAHEPMGYVLGEEDFFGLTFVVGPGVLIPRPDSEVLVETALAARPDARRVLDCGTGSAALLLAVLSRLPDAQGTGIDRSPAALEAARRNVRRLGFDARARIVEGDWDKPGWADDLGGPFDLVLANPPYVEAAAQLEPSVRDYEPEDALFAGAEGLDAYRILLPQMPALLATGGVAAVEIGASQAEAVCAIARNHQLEPVVIHDHADRCRVVRLSHRT